MATWTDDDFRVLYAYLRDVRCLLDDEALYRECRDLLKKEGEEAARRLSRISDAVAARSPHADTVQALSQMRCPTVTTGGPP